MIYVKFTEVPFEGKTKLYVVESVRGSMQLGYIKFYPQWRTYTFMPYPNTMFDVKCLDQINDFIKELNEERKQNLKSN